MPRSLLEEDDKDDGGAKEEEDEDESEDDDDDDADGDVSEDMRIIFVISVCTIVRDIVVGRVGVCSVWRWCCCCGR